MLRLSISAQKLTTRPRAVTANWSVSHLQQRYFSKHNKPEEEEESLSSNNNNNNDALRVFFEKRRAALQKEEQQSSTRWSANKQSNARQNKSKPNVENFLSQNNHNKESDALTSFFEKRRAVLKSQQHPKRGQRKSSFQNNKKQGEWVTRGPPPKDNWSSSFQNNKHNNQKRRQPQKPPSQDSSRLADLMKQLRKDAPVTTSSSAAASREKKDFWRQPRNSNERWNRAPFLNKRSRDDNRTQRNHQQQPRRRPVFRNDSDFLEGRLTRSTEPASAVQGQPEDFVVTIPNHPLTLTELSSLLRIKMGAILQKLKRMGETTMESEDGETRIDVDLMELLALEYGIETVRSTKGNEVVDTSEMLIQQRRTVSEETTLPPRPPVVCIMGHVDHGKTTLMDALRRESMEQQGPNKKVKKAKGKKNKKTSSKSENVAGTEAGGITQIISSFQVALEGQPITFLDTPGHAAFRSMRQSGSHAADVIVLVVAADDGVSEQTIEILDFYKSIEKSSEGGISLVVALNKIDKPGIDVDEAQRRIENQLLQQGIIPEGMGSTEDGEFGAPVQVIPTSGLTGQGLEDLMEGLILQSEVMDLRADDKDKAQGIIMDAAIEKGLGVIATAIIRWGTIKRGDVVVSGDQIGRVKILKDVHGKPLKKGLPSQPVTIVGFKALPKAGDPITCVESEEKAEELLERRASLEKESNRSDAAPADVEIHIPGMRSRDTARSRRVYANADIGECDGFVRIPVIVKADANGSLSAIRESLIQLGKDSEQRVLIDPVLQGIGDITATDIQMAKESNAVIFSFGGKRMDQAILNLAKSENVQIRSNAIIYSLLDEAKQVLGAYLPKAPVEHVHGSALVQATFSIDFDDGEEKIAGLKVLDGHIYKDKTKLDSVELRCNFRVLRDGKQISPEGESVRASSLRRYKELVESVRLGDECGLGLSGFTEFQEGDTIECYSIEMKNILL